MFFRNIHLRSETQYLDLRQFKIAGNGITKCLPQLRSTCWLLSRPAGHTSGPHWSIVTSLRLRSACSIDNQGKAQAKRRQQYWVCSNKRLVISTTWELKRGLLSRAIVRNHLVITFWATLSHQTLKYLVALCEMNVATNFDLRSHGGIYIVVPLQVYKQWPGLFNAVNATIFIYCDHPLIDFVTWKFMQSHTGLPFGQIHGWISVIWLYKKSQIWLNFGAHGIYFELNLSFVSELFCHKLAVLRYLFKDNLWVRIKKFGGVTWSMSSNPGPMLGQSWWPEFKFASQYLLKSWLK